MSAGKTEVDVIVKALTGVTVHTFSAPWGDDYWDRTLDANSKHKLAILILDAQRALKSKDVSGGAES